MSGRGSRVQKASLSALHFAGLDNLAATLTRGTGAILSFHHVLPAAPMAFAPNRHLEVTPEFLDRTVRLVLERGYHVISLDEARGRLAEGDFDRPFICFTFDDGYRDVLQHAHPVFKRYEQPFAVFVAADFADGCGAIWWRALEHLLRVVDAVELKIDGVQQRFSCRRPAAKRRAYKVICRWLENLPEHDAREVVAGLCHRYDVDVSGLCGELAMGWDEIRQLACDPLVTVGAHTRRHVPLGQLSYAEARAEIHESCARIARETGRPCRHFSFPEGGDGPREFELAREAGLATALTSRNGLLKPHHGAALDALPRITLSGELQKLRYVKVMLSGAPFALSRTAERLALRHPSAAAPA
ncbi:MAG TPA: polysaccharide deacetylase family protein [Hyphomicrobiaceae bacterium]|nr:polysaccharide deacetylase family protein [Hyphomicrobiaceae bacterium]